MSCVWLKTAAAPGSDRHRQEANSVRGRLCRETRGCVKMRCFIQMRQPLRIVAKAYF